MVRTIIAITFFSALVLSSTAHAQTCLDYRTEGTSQCKAMPPLKDQRPMEEQVQEYWKTYDKPPREFVEFNLNPTLENALKWAIKQRKLDKRAKEVSAAWIQAQTILDQMEKNGEPLPQLKNDLPDIPDYGVALPEGYEGLGDHLPSQKQQKIIKKNKSHSFFRRDAGFFNPASGKVENITKGPQQKINVSYYFSADCPYCKKFEPGFQSVIKEMGDMISVTCVDMSPSGQKPENIMNKVDCLWRPIADGEQQQMRVTSTPTLLVDRGIKGKALEKVSGNMDVNKLRKFLKGY